MTRAVGVDNHDVFGEIGFVRPSMFPYTFYRPKAVFKKEIFHVACSCLGHIYRKNRVVGPEILPVT